MAVEKVLVAGGWRNANAKSTFQAENPATGAALDGEFPISEWQDCDDALTAAAAAAQELRTVAAEKLANFLELYAKKIEENAAALVEKAAAETGLATTPRLKDVELPRTTTQLRQGAAAAREGSWTRAVLDTKAKTWVAEKGYDPVFGARPLKRFLQRHLGTRLARGLIAGDITEESTVTFKVKDDELVIA